MPGRSVTPGVFEGSYSYSDALDLPHEGSRWQWQLGRAEGRAELCPDWLRPLNWSLPVPYHLTSLLAQLRVPEPP